MIFINKRSVSPFNRLPDDSEEEESEGEEVVGGEEAKLGMKVPSDFKSFIFAPNYYKDNAIQKRGGQYFV